MKTYMKAKFKFSSRAVAALLLVWSVFSAHLPAMAQTEVLDQLFADLQDPETDHAAVEDKIWREWGKSGSDAMDLLLERGRAAVNAGDLSKAIEHFSALIDHAPEFAEGWNARATAFFLADEYGLSVNDIQSTLSLNPRHFGALSGLGMIMEQIEENENALRAYQAALAVHPFRPNLIAAVKRLQEKTAGTEL